MNISETEIQILASLSKLEAESSLTDQKSIEARGAGYWIFKEVWEGAFEKLLAKNIIEGNENGYRLTSVGRPLWENKSDVYRTAEVF